MPETYQNRANMQMRKETPSVKNTVISPNFLAWKLCGKAQFPQNFHTRELDKITGFYAVTTV